LRALLLAVSALAAASPAISDTLVLTNGRKVEVASPLRAGGRIVDSATRGQAFAIPEEELSSPPLWTLPVLMRLKNGQEFVASGLAWKDGKIRFQVGATGEKIQVADDQVVYPPPLSIPRLLTLKTGQDVPALQVARTDGRVRFQVASTGEKVQVAEDQVAAPPLAMLPVLLRLANGQEIPVTGLERAGDKVRFQVAATGEKIQVASAQVLSPPLNQIVALGGPTTAPGPSPAPTPGPAKTPAPTATPAPIVPVAPPAPPQPPAAVARFETLTDRWRILDTLLNRLPADPRLVRGHTGDPYNQNTLKGDRPVIGQDVFLVLTGTLDVPFEARRLPLPSGVSAAAAESYEFFGNGNEIFSSPEALVSAELFKGDTAFKPKSWSFKATGAFDVNTLKLNEENGVNVDVRAGTTRTKEKAALQEAFAEVKIADLSPYYDVLSVRAGIQPFVSDFRGFVFSDSNLGARVFGNAANNTVQYNAAYFDLLEKDTNSDLNTFQKRNQKVFVANLFRQDSFAHGFTLEASYHRSQDEASKEFYYDQNGFLVRPAKIGSPRLHNITSNYVGLTGDGHLGRLNLDGALYYVFGHDSGNPLGDPEQGGQGQDISAELGALELSLDRDWARFRISGFYASGDGNAEDGKASGFDSIDDLVNFAGGPFSFWNRSAIPLTQTGVLLKTPGSLLPDLRSSKFEGQANFVNPGIVLANAGLDLLLTPKLKAVVNANYLRFADTAALSFLLFQPGIRKDIGIDLGAGVVWRPALNQNVVITAGVTGLLPGGGADDLFSSPCPGGAQGCGASSQKLYNAFVELRLTY
jgi:hypothetical protein